MFTTNEYLGNRPLVTATMVLLGAMLMSQASSPNRELVLLVAGSLAGLGTVIAGGEFCRQRARIRWVFLAQAIVGAMLVVGCEVGILGW